MLIVLHHLCFSEDNLHTYRRSVCICLHAVSHMTFCVSLWSFFYVMLWFCCLVLPLFLVILGLFVTILCVFVLALHWHLLEETLHHSVDIFESLCGDFYNTFIVLRG